MPAGVAADVRRATRQAVRATARRFPRAGSLAAAGIRATKSQLRQVKSRINRKTSPAAVAPLFASLRELLLPTRGRTVVVLAPDELTLRALTDWLGDLQTVTAHVFAASPRPGWSRVPVDIAVHTAPDAEAVHQELKRLPPIDVIVDLAAADGASLRRCGLLFWHLSRGGVYVVASPDGQAELSPEVRRWLGAVATGSHGALEGRARIPRDLPASVSLTLARPEAGALVKRHDHLLKLRDAESDELLPRRDPTLAATKLAVRAGGSFLARDTVVHHVADVGVEWPDATVAYPDMHLRHYAGALSYGTHTLAYTDRSILPECFRWHLIKNPSNPATVNSSADFARVPDDRAPTQHLEGPFYQADPQHGGFGHVMTEMVGRLWGWEEAKRQLPELKAIFSVQNVKAVTKSPKYQILRAYGIAAEDIVWTNRFVTMDSLVGATDMWHNNVPHYVHPDLPEVWDRIGAGMIDREQPTFDKIFISRGPNYRRRICRNADEVEAVFRQQGFEIIYPEEWSLPQQAAIFAAARVIAGFGGSGLFNLMFAQNLEVAIFLNQDSYYHRNEHLFTSLIGGTIHYYWSPADLTQDAGGQNVAAAESAWDFAFDRHGEDLRGLLNSL